MVNGAQPDAAPKLRCAAASTNACARCKANSVLALRGAGERPPIWQAPSSLNLWD